MAAFAEALYDTNSEPLHLVLDEADLWAPQRPLLVVAPDHENARRYLGLVWRWVPRDQAPHFGV